MSTDNPAQQEPPDTDSTPCDDPGSGTDSGGTGHDTGTGCNDCQTGLSDVKCEAEGIAAQAKYNAESQPALLTAQTTYADARRKYREQRCLMHNEVADLKNQAKHQLERARCLIRQEHVVTCLEKAWDKVKAELQGCGKPPCCSELDCTFTTETTGLDDHQLDNVISDVAKRADQARACFDELADEPNDLTLRLAALKAEIAKITAVLGDDPAKVDPKAVWAQARVAHWHAKHFWHGFDTISNYVDCLCNALKCWTNGTRALSVLRREQAVRACHKAESDLRCQTVRTQTVEEVLAWYDKVCPAQDCGCGAKEEDGDKEPCGCGGKHHGDDSDDKPCGCGHHESEGSAAL